MVKKGKKGLFRPPKHKFLERIITFDSVSAARKAARKLVNSLERGRLGKMRIGQKRALTICRALQNAANRAEVSASKNPVFKKQTRVKWKSVSEVYEKAADKAWKIYHEKYG